MTDSLEPRPGGWARLAAALTRERVGLVLLYLGLGFVSAALWARLALLSGLAYWHAQMVLGYAPAPNQYRPLTPFVAEWLRPLMPRHSVYEAYFTLRALVTGGTLLCFDRYLRTWFSNAAAAAGALCLAAIIPFTYYAVIQESDPINLLVFVAAFWALAHKRDRLLLPLVLVGTVNRETTALIPVVYLAARWRRALAWRALLRAALLGAAWILVYGAILAAYGRRGYITDEVKLSQNLASWGPTILVILMFGVMWILPFVAARRSPRLLRRALWLLPPYVLLHYVVALVQEVRLFLPFAPVLIPLSWWSLFPEALRDPTGEGEA